MPATVVNDPESIHAYRQQIAERIEQLRGLITKTEGAIQTVSESWKDNQFQQFHNNFNQDMAQIKPLCDVLSNYEGNLLYQLENKLRTYTDYTMHL